MFFSQKLKKYKNLKHCFFSRQNGFSNGLYSSLNCGLGSKDNTKNVLKNLNIVSKEVGCKNELLITLNQSHSNKVVYLENKNSVKNKLPGDAIVTKIKNVGIGILTADCASILLYDPKEEIIGCIHSGWKGALNGIIKNTINKFIELNSNTSDLIAVVGPCIKTESYEVKNDFYQNFINRNSNYKIFFDITPNNKIYFDLRGFINAEIHNLNVKNVENINRDTFTEHKNFFSYRRSLLNKEKDYGRCISVILMS